MTSVQFQNVAKVISLIILSVGILVLAGWGLEINFLRRPIPGLVAMNPLSAFGFVLSGFALFLTAYNRDRINQIGLVINLLCIVIIASSVLKLVDYYFDFNTDIENWLFTSRLVSDNLLGLSNRMAPETAYNFILCGIAIWFSRKNNNFFNSVANYVSVIIFGVALFSALGYLFSVPEFRTAIVAHPMAVHSAICFLLVSLCILLINHDKGFMKDFTGSNEGGIVARVFTASIFFIAVFYGLFLIFLHEYYLLSAQLLIAIGAAALIISAFFIVWYLAARLNSISTKRNLAEKNLLLSDERFFKFFKSSPVATNIIRIGDGKMIHANNAFLRLFGFLHEEVIGKTSVELKMIDSETREKILSRVKEKGFHIENVEVKLRDSKGKMKEVLSSTQTIDLKGELHMLNTLVDITDRKRIEKEIESSRQRLKDAQKLSKTGSWDFNLKTQELIWSEELYDIFELDYTEPEKLYDECRKKIHPEDLEMMDIAIQSAIEKGVAITYEHRVILKNGEIKYLLGLGEIINDENGKPELLRGTTQDITEQIRAQKVVEEMKKNLAAAQKIANLGSWQWDMVSNSESWSDEQFRIFGLEPDEIVPTYTFFTNSIHPDDKERVLEEVDMAIKGTKEYNTEFRIITKNKQEKYVEAKGEIERNIDGIPVLMRGTVLDISERKKFEELLKAANQNLELKNRELEQFAFIASHDLQEPLRTISSFTDLLIEEYGSTFDENESIYVNYISQSSGRMRDLITALLEYSRLGNRRELRKTDCNTVLENVKHNLHTSITQSKTKIVSSYLPVINAYSEELELLFQNLISNAIKFRKKDVSPEIFISADNKNNEWQFSFADNGIGIDNKHNEKIFQLFQRLHTRDSYEGSGIGLSHCKKIVELHNGRIWVESKKDVGSVFYFTIPENKS